MALHLGFLPVFESSIAAMKADGITGEDAYGKMLGTVMVCCFIEIIFSFVPKAGRLLRTISTRPTLHLLLLLRASVCAPRVFMSVKTEG